MFLAKTGGKMEVRRMKCVPLLQYRLYKTFMLL